MLSEACVCLEKGQLLDFNGNSMKNIFEYGTLLCYAMQIIKIERK